MVKSTNIPGGGVRFGLLPVLDGAKVVHEVQLPPRVPRALHVQPEDELVVSLAVLDNLTARVGVRVSRRCQRIMKLKLK